MTNWLTTVMTRRSSSTRHLGAGMDADIIRMAHELSLMSQRSPKAGADRPEHRDHAARRHLSGIARTRVDDSYETYPAGYRRMADRYHPTLSTR